MKSSYTSSARPALIALGFSLLATLVGCQNEGPAVEQLKGMQVLVVTDPTSGKASSLNNLPSDPAKLDQAMDQVGSLSKLKSFTVIGTVGVPFEDKHMAKMAGLSSLTNVDISNVGVTDEGAKHLEGLGKVETLSLAATKITGAALSSICKLSQLSILNVAQTNVDSNFAALQACEKLEWLVVSDLTISDAEADAIAAIPNLKRVSLQRAKISPASIKKLRATATVDEGGEIQGLGGEILEPEAGDGESP